MISSVAAVVVTYYPEPSLPERLDTVLAQVKKVAVVDNTGDESAAGILAQLHTRGCHIIKNPANAGIAAALNQGVDWAAGQGYEWILTLDDDTRVFDGLVAIYTAALQSELAGCRVGVMNARYLDVNTGTLGAEIPGKKYDDQWAEVKVMISSGSFFSIETYREAGRFQEEFFLDWFDHDFCIRVRRCGRKNFMYARPMLEHELGRKTAHRIPGTGIKVTANNHVAKRCYLITRNLIWIIKENFFKEFGLSTVYIAYIAYKFFIVAFFEQDKQNKLAALRRGLLDGIRGRKCSAADIIKNGRMR
ncbi:MAG: glycosyltransferase [Candidatus Omnitrophica bacterium]|nr:glycosyltransferase [Candidatus Omnitrophota bacterium]